MKGIQRHDLQVVFSSFSRSTQSEPIVSLLQNSGYQMFNFASVANIENNLAGNKVLVVDIDMSVCEIDQLLNFLRSKSPEIPCLFIFHCGQNDLNVSLLEYCCDFVTWPCESGELFYRLHTLVNRNLEKEAELTHYQQANEIIGNSEAFRNVLKRIKTFSACDAPVLIEGETGTGKEMIARAVHYYSSRKDHPFIPVNCGALPDNLIENELFGHAKGAYTDAKNSSKGLVGQAEGGTLFLDEIESLSLKCQVALLRLLQEQEYKPLGASEPLKSDVRIVTASNINLSELVENGQMRQDLFFRLNILSLRLPPLRKRHGDVSLLAGYFLKKIRQQYNLPFKQYHQSTIDWLENYHWPGNIRELENMVLRAALVAEGEYIFPTHIVDESFCLSGESDIVVESASIENESFSEAKHRIIERFEKEYLLKLMEKYSGNVSMAAKKACKERSSLGKLLKKHGINRTQFL